ncbi:MAG: HD domain-containing protein [Gemmataceae bacterium]|nr:HD domain-containing protein [Gemmataceae bacterium]MDW8267061.1 HD domain-containing protein [Gemmataceae bacterium]
MARAKPKPVRLCELTPGQHGDFFALLAERTRSATRDGKPYYTCRFRDLHRTATFVAWSDGAWFERCETEWREGGFYKIRGTYLEHERYGPQIDIENIRAVVAADHEDGFDPLSLVERSRHDPEVMAAELRTLVTTEIADEPLRRLVLMILDRHGDALRQRPATTNKFFPFAGGLLEHTLSVVRNCLLLADKYRQQYPDLRPPLNRDLIVAAAVLHDIGRVLEFSDDVGSPQPTVPGRLLGHLFLGRDLVRDTAREIVDIDPELLLLLEHMIVAHLNLPEWGSARLPLVPECLILHHADDLDAKLEMYVRCLSRDVAPGPFTERDPVLGRPLLKERTR